MRKFIGLLCALCVAVTIASCDNDSSIPTTPPTPTPTTRYVIGIAGGNYQTGVRSTTLPLPLAIRLYRATQTGVIPVGSGFKIRWIGTTSDSITVTDSTGLTTTHWTLSSALGLQSVKTEVVIDTTESTNFIAWSVAPCDLQVASALTTYGTPVSNVTKTKTEHGVTTTTTTIKWVLQPGDHDQHHEPDGDIDYRTMTFVWKSNANACTITTHLDD